MKDVTKQASSSPTTMANQRGSGSANCSPRQEQEQQQQKQQQEQQQQQQQQSRVVGSYLLKFAEKNHFGSNYAKFLESTYGGGGQQDKRDRDGDRCEKEAEEEKASTPPGSTAEEEDEGRAGAGAGAGAGADKDTDRDKHAPRALLDDNDNDNDNDNEKANDAQVCEYDPRVATLSRVLGSSSWTNDRLAEVLRLKAGNLAVSITAVLEHGDYRPDDLIRRLRIAAGEGASPPAATAPPPTAATATANGNEKGAGRAAAAVPTAAHETAAKGGKPPPASPPRSQSRPDKSNNVVAAAKKTERAAESRPLDLIGSSIPTELVVNASMMDADDVSVLSSGLTVAEERGYFSYANPVSYRHRPPLLSTRGYSKYATNASGEGTGSMPTGAAASRAPPEEDDKKGKADADNARSSAASRTALPVIRDEDESASDPQLPSPRLVAYAGGAGNRAASHEGGGTRRGPPADPPSRAHTYTSSTMQRGDREDRAEEGATENEKKDEDHGFLCGDDFDDDTIGILEKKVLQLVGKLGGDGDSSRGGGGGGGEIGENGRPQIADDAFVVVDAAVTESATATATATTTATALTAAVEDFSTADTAGKRSMIMAQDAVASYQMLRRQRQQQQQQRKRQDDRERQYIAKIRRQEEELTRQKSEIQSHVLRLRTVEAENDELRERHRTATWDLERENEALRQKVAKLTGKVGSLSAALESMISMTMNSPSLSPPSSAAITNATAHWYHHSDGSSPPNPALSSSVSDDDDDDEDDDDDDNDDDDNDEAVGMALNCGVDFLRGGNVRHVRNSSRAYI